MDNNYVSVVDDVYRLTGTRVSLDSIVYDYLSGLSPESIADNFDSLSLEQVYGAITFYLSHEQEIDSYLSQGETQLNTESEARKAQARAANPDLFERIEKARHERETSPR